MLNYRLQKSRLNQLMGSIMLALSILFIQSVFLDHCSVQSWVWMIFGFLSNVFFQDGMNALHTSLMTLKTWGHEFGFSLMYT